MEFPQAIVAIVMLGVCVLLGLPVWWNTTKVYRATLPHSKIEELSQINSKVIVTVSVVLEKKELWSEVVKSKAELENELFEINFQVESGFDLSNNDLENQCQQLALSSTNKNKSDFEIKMIIFYTKDESFSYYCESGLSYIISAKEKEIVHAIVSVLKAVLPIDESIVPDVKTKGKPSQSLSLSAGYDLVFTLAIGEPSSTVASWDIEESIQSILNSFLKKMEFLGPFRVSSQVLYKANIGIEPKLLNNSNETFYYYTKQKISLMMNPLESRLSTYTSTNAGINFIIYVPPAKHSPLFIRSAKIRWKSKAFHSPRWGGIQIHDLTSYSNIDIKTKEYMKTFLIQLQMLNGLDPFAETTLFPKNQPSLLTKPMQIRLKALRIFKYLKTSISTLSSLSKLLDEIANIVIRDDIKDLIDISVVNIEKAIKSLHTGDLEVALRCSKKAYECSEKAFFDWSLLALLYFPDDQKYAIYVPLFLPISLPIFLSFFNAVKFLQSKNKCFS